MSRKNEKRKNKKLILEFENLREYPSKEEEKRIKELTKTAEIFIIGSLRDGFNEKKGRSVVIFKSARIGNMRMIEEFTIIEDLVQESCMETPNFWDVWISRLEEFMEHIEKDLREGIYRMRW